MTQPTFSNSPAPASGPVDPAAFVEVYLAGELPTALAPGWTLRRVEWNGQERRLALFVERPDGKVVEGWVDRIWPDRKALTTTARLSLGYGKLPDGEAAELASVLRRFAERLKGVEARLDAARLSSVFAGPPRKAEPETPRRPAPPDEEGALPVGIPTELAGIWLPRPGSSRPPRALPESWSGVERRVTTFPFVRPRRDQLVDRARSRQLDEQGFAVVPMLDADGLERARGWYEEVGRDLLRVATASHASRDLLSIHDLPGAAARRALDDWATAFAAPYLGFARPDLVAFSGQFLVKPPHVVGTAWHLDATLWDPTRTPTLRVWCPLLDVGAGRGAMRLVPGSHRFSAYLRGWGQRPEHGPLGPALPELFSRSVCVPLEAGEALVWNTDLFHASEDNPLDVERVVFSVTLGEPDAEFLHPVAISQHEVACFRSTRAEVASAIPSSWASVAGRVPDFIAETRGGLRSAEELAALS